MSIFSQSEKTEGVIGKYINNFHCFSVDMAARLKIAIVVSSLLYLVACSLTILSVFLSVSVKKDLNDSCPGFSEATALLKSLCEKSVEKYQMLSALDHGVYSLSLIPT